MYRSKNNQFVYSPTDLTLFMRSPFASWMERYALEYPDRIQEKDDVNAMMDLLAKKGDAHEANFLQSLIEAKGEQNVAQISRDLTTAAQQTDEAIKAGFDVIFQAYLQRDEFKGFTDFLIKRPGKSSLGDYYYEVWDTKLAKSTRPYFITQLCCYNWMLEGIQGYLPDEIVVVLGDQTEDRIRVSAQYAYFEVLKSQFLLSQAVFTGDLSQTPDPAFCSNYGRWENYAKRIMKDSDSLSMIANIRKSHIKKLHGEGITTMTQLAHSDVERINGMARETLEKLKAQALIQLESKDQPKPKFRVLDTQKGKGLKALPAKSHLDVYFDIEGHPLMEGGLEYLWGVSYEQPEGGIGKEYSFKDWWAHDREQEKRAFEGFIDWVYQRWQQDPSMHVYHYASYEVTAINKLAMREQTRLEEVAELLTNGVFVDLYRIVINGLLIGEPKYSIKNVEHLYRGKRETEVANGGDSVVFYEGWRESGGDLLWRDSFDGYATWTKDPEDFNWDQWPVLKDIRDYNIDDCESTLQLVAWLRKVQDQQGVQYEPAHNELLIEIAKTDKQLDKQASRDELIRWQQALIERQANDPSLCKDEPARLLSTLLHFHVRERKPKAFSYYQRQEKTDEELVDDDTVIYDVTIQKHTYEDQKLQCFATFSADQPIRKDKIKSATIRNTNIKVSRIEFEDHDEHRAGISFLLDAEYERALQQSPLVLYGEDEYISTESLEIRLCEITEAYFETGQLPRVLETLLGRGIPRLTTQALPISRTLFPGDEPYIQAIIQAIKALDESVLCIQGPPGAGKTHTSKSVIKALIESGKRIGVMSNSHAAIMNLIKSLAEDLPYRLIAKVGGSGSQSAFEEAYPKDRYPGFRYRGSMQFTKAEPFEQFSVVGATVYGFAKDLAYETPFDYLFVDEASQVSMANLVVASGATKNIILMGDQMQLEQPIQGVHPGDAGLSSLEFMLGDHSVIPDDRGIFLERTYRMHPHVCDPLSDVIYEGKLQADAPNAHQAVLINHPALITKESGILPIWLDHEGNTQSSEEEVATVKDLLEELKTGRFRDKTNKFQMFSDEDVLVVAPYNMQVNLLKDRLPEGTRIGTIDKFQGQEAPVVIISMAVSDVDESPRGMEFIFNMNRLNVAISRAKALAIVVASRKLQQVPVTNLRQMERAGLFYKLTQTPILNV